MKIVIGYCDTEGTPHVRSNESELWNVAIVFKHVVDTEGVVKPQDIFHVTHLSLNKKAKRSDIKKPLGVHFKAIEFIKETYDAGNVHVGFWGAGHDMAVLKSYGQPIPFIPFDLLSIAKRINKDNGLQSYNIGNLCNHFGVHGKIRIHTGLGDVLRTIDLLPYLGISTSDLLVIDKTKTTVNAKHKHNEKNTRTVRRHGATGPTTRPDTCTTTDITTIFERNFNI
jgi:hypothetical protein